MITLIKGKPHTNGLEIIAPPSPLLICSCSFLRTKIDTQILAPRPTGTTYFLRREAKSLGRAVAAPPSRAGGSASVPEAPFGQLFSSHASLPPAVQASPSVQTSELGKHVPGRYTVRNLALSGDLCLLLLLLITTGILELKTHCVLLVRLVLTVLVVW